MNPRTFFECCVTTAIIIGATVALALIFGDILINL